MQNIYKTNLSHTSEKCKTVHFFGFVVNTAAKNQVDKNSFLPTILILQAQAGLVPNLIRRFPLLTNRWKK